MSVIENEVPILQVMLTSFQPKDIFNVDEFSVSLEKNTENNLGGLKKVLVYCLTNDAVYAEHCPLECRSTHAEYTYKKILLSTTFMRC